MNEQQKQLNELLLKKQIEENKQFVTLKDIAEKHLVGYRTLERNLTHLKNLEQLTQQGLIYKEPTKQNKWIVHKSIVPLVARRKIYKLIRGEQLDPTLQLIRKHSKDLTIYGTITAGYVGDKEMWLTIITQIFNYYASGTDKPVKMLFSFEDNQRTFKNKEGDNEHQLHCHYICDYPHNTEADLIQQHNDFYEIMIENIDPKNINKLKFAEIRAYDHSYGQKGINYVTKFTGSENSKLFTGIIAQ